MCACRERAAYLYAAGPWSLAQVTVEIPFLIVQGILYTMIVYWCTGQSADAGERWLSGQLRFAVLQPGGVNLYLSAAPTASQCSRRLMLPRQPVMQSRTGCRPRQSMVAFVTAIYL